MANFSWKIARNRGGAQLPLMIVAVLAIGLVLVGKAQTALFDRVRAQLTDWTAPLLEVARAPADDFRRWSGAIGQVFTVYRENLRLREENARLRQWQNAALVLQDRVNRYQQLMHAVPDPKMSSVLARVIGRSNQPFLQTMVLDAGKTDGVKPGQAVVDARGLIGRIYLAGQHTSWVIQLTDVNSRIPVTIVPGNVQAIMTGDNGPTPLLDTLSANVTLTVGAQVVSSGDGGLLPAGRPIGTVIQTRSGFRVALLADGSAAQDVQVLDFVHAPETPPQPSAADLPVAAAGLPPAAPPPPPAAEAPPPVPQLVPVTPARPAIITAPTSTVPVPPTDEER